MDKVESLERQIQAMAKNALRDHAAGKTPLL